MRCNLIKAVCFTLAVSAAGTALAAQKASQGGITLFAERQSQGSQWDSTTGEAQYMVSYKVTLNNASDKSIEPGKDNKMCFFLFDKNGKSFMSTGIELEMLKKYKPMDNRTGMVYFSSSNPDVLNMPFVRFGIGQDCTKG
ncbi:hypothetical protein EC036_21760 [Enterobacter cloacae]|uniref:DUF4354 family protein n=1 Tax=Enterobacter TaxID=547 RepID=UPI00052AE71F|nr:MULTISPECIES: DUF4354 family protein [Enterobacter]HCM9439757.1 DUF4354 family protein [Enterobacter cloacae subsp. cloacae]AIV29823.1 hypothetical protein EC036_21760 [Enterobacter cloacae]AOE95608.1 hypothetical protein BFJ73_10415 [Enterobacter cloacae]EMB9072977.1 DUF4354 family protein [Enterobacter cloacae]MCE1969334.1 DUF4354 family protein [Enterobacter cloacae]